MSVMSVVSLARLILLRPPPLPLIYCGLLIQFICCYHQIVSQASVSTNCVVSGVSSSNVLMNALLLSPALTVGPRHLKDTYVVR